MTSAATTPEPRRVGLGLLLQLAWPIIVSRSSQIVIGLSDALMIAELGEAALAATTTGAFNTFALLILPMGLIFIVSSFTAQLAGAGDRPGARRFGFYGLGVALITQALCFGAIAATPTLLGWLNYAPEVRELMTQYLGIRLLSGGAVIGIEALGNYYGGLGNTRIAMIINLIAMVLNVGGNFLLIHGRFGFPAMGVSGAALASTVSSFAAFAVFLLVFLLEGRRHRGMGRLSGSEFLRVLRFGTPSGLNWFFEFFAFNFFINIVVAGLGTTALAAMMAVMQINHVAFMPAFGLASAGAILVGQSIGANRREEVAGHLKLTFLAAGGWQCLAGLFYLLIPTLLLLPFTSETQDSTEFLRVGVRILMLTAAWQLFDAAAMTIAETLRAAGDTAFTLWARLLISWVVFVPGSYLTVTYLGWGEVGAMLWVMLYLALLSIALLVRFRRGRWKELSLLGTAPG